MLVFTPLYNIPTLTNKQLFRTLFYFYMCSFGFYVMKLQTSFQQFGFIYVAKEEPLCVVDLGDVLSE